MFVSLNVACDVKVPPRDWTKDFDTADDSDLEEDYPFDKNEIMSGFENFKKELPQDVLEKNCEELIAELGLDH